LPEAQQKLSIDWIASYPRSGNTWTRFLLTYAVFGESAGDWNIDVNRACVDAHYWAPSLPMCRNPEYRAGVEASMAQELRTGVRNLRKHWPLGDQHYILKTHFKLSEEHPLLRETNRAVYLLRHPLLVARSSHAFYTMLGFESRPLDIYLEEFIDHGGDPRMIAQGFGTWAENRKSWLTSDRVEVLEVRFEDLRSDTPGQLTKMLDFLGLESSTARAETAAQLASQDRLSALEEDARNRGAFSAGNHEVSDQGRTINKGLIDIQDQVSPDALARFRSTWAEVMGEAGYPMP